MLLLRLVLPLVPLVLVVLLASIASFWVKSQPKLEENPLKTLLYCDGLALYDGHYAYQ